MTSGHQIAMALRAAYLSMHRQADAALQQQGVTANQFVLLSLLADQDQVTQRDLVERASSDPNTIRPMLVALEKKGYVVREPHPDDGRAWLVCLTPAGRAAFRKMNSETDSFRERLISTLQPREADQLLSMLQRISTKMTDTG
jgi:DNA-binding MarR family transcriptional regulator